MTVAKMSEILKYEILSCGESANERKIEHVYCCDLLSHVMGSAKSGDAWVSVMGNINAIAVAALADCACLILAHGAAADAEVLKKAESQDIIVLRSAEPIFETAMKIHLLLNGGE